jgi:hypothetical protein
MQSFYGPQASSPAKAVFMQEAGKFGSAAFYLEKTAGNALICFDTGVK